MLKKSIISNTNAYIIYIFKIVICLSLKALSKTTHLNHIPCDPECYKPHKSINTMGG